MYKNNIFTGISGAIAVIVFASLGNTDGWMPDHTNNYLGILYYSLSIIRTKNQKSIDILIDNFFFNFLHLQINN